MLVAICDDEKAECEKVTGILAQKMRKRREPLQIVCFQQGEDLIEQYEDGRKPGYDLIFMDIFLQKENGMEIVRRLRGYDRDVSVVFLTSSPDYAVESYEVWADGYLLKPVSQDKLENLLNRFMEKRYPRLKRSLLMVGGTSGRRIAYDDILYVESQRMNLRIVCSGGEVHRIRKKLDEVQAELTQSRFLRCNQSYIVNMDYITSADTNFTMENGDKIPIKVRERKKIREQYFSYLLKLGWGCVDCDGMVENGKNNAV